MKQKMVEIFKLKKGDKMFKRIIMLMFCMGKQMENKMTFYK